MSLADDVRRNLQHSGSITIWVWCCPFWKNGEFPLTLADWRTGSCATLLPWIAKSGTARRVNLLETWNLFPLVKKERSRIGQSPPLIHLYLCIIWGTCLEWIVACIISEALPPILHFHLGDENLSSISFLCSRASKVWYVIKDPQQVSLEKFVASKIIER